MKTYIILFGITGDLSRRMLLPSLESLLSSELISNIFLYGVSRRDLKKEDIFSQDSLLSENFKSIKLDENIQDYKNLLNSIELENNDQILIYLSVPPTSALSYVKKLGEAGFNKKNIKLLLEKPFGINYSSAKNFLCEINQYFSEEQVYKVDHYMAKKNSQFIIPFKIANQSFFEEFFNNKFVEKIEVLGLEQIDIQGRSIFYEQTGALRDFIQGHLMQLLILTLCDAKDKDINHILQQRSECVNELSLLNDDSCTNAQYEGYKEEVNNEKSNVETYAKVVLNSSNPK
jgi:glucose-6-phosphate 1-dehydrogenase